ncbi:MAG TPA: hypothetical protein VFU47_09105 [Armatimonadota bacterium]|nr:hypothetical protein [Armatimonadota bacterium]
MPSYRALTSAELEALETWPTPALELRGRATAEIRGLRAQREYLSADLRAELLIAQQEREGLLQVLRKVYASAAESPEWMRRVVGDALAEYGERGDK